MKTAFAVWDDRIAPVFDVARQLHIVEIKSGSIVGAAQKVLRDDMPIQKARHLATLGVDTLVCGAISRPLEAMITACGIRVVSFVAGDLCDVIEAWLKGRLEKKLFAMPGCFGRKRPHLQNTHGIYQQEKYPMNGKKSDKRGSRSGQVRSGRRSGRMGGSLAAGPGGYCLCPQCGTREPHERGIPCSQKQCPKCRVPMTRQ